MNRCFRGLFRFEGVRQGDVANFLKRHIIYGVQLPQVRLTSLVVFAEKPSCFRYGRITSINSRTALVCSERFSPLQNIETERK